MSPQTFKAIETTYKGYRFRSRIEARWAVFFDTLSIPYEYEKEGYVLEGIPYLPDFWLPEQECFVEIKGQKPTKEEQEKIRLLATYTSTPVYMFFGNISFPSEDTEGADGYLAPHGMLSDCRWYECSRCGEFYIHMAPAEYIHYHLSHYGCPYDPKGLNLDDTPRLIEAYAAARQARFDKSER